MEFTIGPLERVQAAAEKELKRQTDDDLFVLNQLQSINKDAKSPFYGRIIANTAGAFGHSFGGAVAAQLCYLDPRIRAALDLDGSLGRCNERGFTSRSCLSLKTLRSIRVKS